MASRETFDTWVLRIVGVLATAGIVGGIVAHGDLRVLKRDVDALTKTVDDTRGELKKVDGKVDDVSAIVSDTAGLLRGLGVEPVKKRKPHEDTGG